jgi:uncharacterized protein (TIGR02145 family)
MLLFIGCPKPAEEMMVITGEVTSTFTNYAEVSGQVIDLGDGAIQYGHCYAKTSDVSINNSTTNLGNPKTGIFTSRLINLEPGTKYYVKAYLKNNINTAYGEEISFTTLQNTPITDIDGNVYNTVVIGSQTWMKEDLKTTKYKDGTTIPLVTDNAAWSTLTTPGYCWYNNDAATYKNTYGALYNWYTVNTGKLCPSGWHVPTNAEWTTLTTYVGGEEVAGGILKESGTTHWASPNAGATNETGFTALPSGNRSSDYGEFSAIGYYGAWWSSIELSPYAWLREMAWNDSIVDSFASGKRNGLAVRCTSDY